MNYAIALLTGMLFGIGMALSGMVNPELVTAFLDVSGQWNPTLMFVMGGALAVFIPIEFSNYCITAQSREHRLNSRPASLQRLFQASQQQSTIFS
ncbi:DUF6691 family protein [Endozoicomonas atrinae]|uniref:DUF6691 family protein n=1 Tax=Endozoicomonas atrinae TaxID=1333660 RepID=UPI000A5C2C16|nr:DUF6691 family protein [Endozoicomonas atrinae]